MEEKIENEPTENGGDNQESEGLLAADQAREDSPETAQAVMAGPSASEPKRRRQEKVGLVTSDKMTKTVVVRVERQVRHQKYKRYIRRRSKFMAHDEMGARIGDIVRIIETRPMSARKRWRVIEIVQKAN